MTDWNTILNPEQCEAAIADDGPLLVLAAAGTGKTRTLTHRVAYLIEQGVLAHEILLLTFTNRAAHEMLDRARELVGPAIGGLWSGTFHHVCNRFLRIHADQLGYKRDFVILDSNDSGSLIDRCIKGCVAKPSTFPKKAVVASLISRAQNQGVSISEVVDEAFLKDAECEVEDLVRIAQLYNERKQEGNFMDFDDLLINGVRLLETCAEVRERYTQQFRYVLVDEYQDTNALQSRLVDILASGHRNLMTVGDDFQCIYSWRGADFRNIMDFKTRWPEAKIVKLERNYRSVPGVLALANASIAQNTDQFEKTLRPTREGNAKPTLAYLQNGQEQAIAVVHLVQRAIVQGYAYKDVAVLYRSHFHAMELERLLAKFMIPYTLTSGVCLYEQVHIKDTIAFLRVCRGRPDLFSFTRLLELLPSCGPKTAEKIWNKCGEAFNPADPVSRQALIDAIPTKAKADWLIIDHIFEECYKEDDLPAGKAIKAFTKQWYNTYLRRAYDNAEDREQDLDELANQLRYGENVDAFLDEVALYTNTDRAEANADAINLSTVHQAKGLEWPVVAVLWLNEDMFPSPKAGEDVSEERRLFYVAVTRARDSLLLCTANMRQMPNGHTLYLKPSRFIRELPNGLLTRRYGL